MNLQLFAVQSYHVMLTDSGSSGGSAKKNNTNKTTVYDPNSIVDYLKQNGQDSSMSARKEIAKNLGIANYNGSGDQNTLMLNTLKNAPAK